MGLIPLLLGAMRQKRYFEDMKKMELASREAAKAKKAASESDSGDNVIPSYTPKFNLKTLLGTQNLFED